ncbi:MAG: hypothetical protein GXY87_01120 [Tissierellia bacterium]|nr:hypothetical protein [Tissierellia bacterium]
MLSANIEQDLLEKLEVHAKENNITVDVLLESILYEYFEELEANGAKLIPVKDEVGLAASLGDDEFNDANYEYLRKQFGM